MSCKTRVYRTLLVGFLLSLRVCVDAKCIPSFKDYVTDNLLKDHLFKYENFQRPSEATKTEYTVLSIFNMLCSSWTASKDDLKNFVCENNCKHERDSRKCLMDSYAMILATYLGTDYNNTTGIMTLCDKHYCSFSYSTEYITANEFEEKYSSTCRWDGQFPDCPSPQSPSSTPLQVFTTPLSSHGSSMSTPASTTRHQSTSTTSSLSQDSHTTDPPVSEGATSSLSQDSYKTDSPVSEDSSPYTSLATTDHQDNINNGSRKGENTEQQTQTFTLLLTLSLLTNVILLIGVWHQHRSRHRPYRQGYPDIFPPTDSMQMPLRNGDVELQGYPDISLPTDSMQMPLRNGDVELQIPNDAYGTLRDQAT